MMKENKDKIMYKSNHKAVQIWPMQDYYHIYPKYWNQYYQVLNYSYSIDNKDNAAAELQEWRE